MKNERRHARRADRRQTTRGSAAPAPPRRRPPGSTSTTDRMSSGSAATARSIAGAERELRFSVRDAAGAPIAVEPYMGMAAHLAIASRDGSVFAHLHPSGSISMAAMQKFAGGGADPHAGHIMTMDSAVAIPYAFPKPGPYRLFFQVRRGGRVRTAAFDVDVHTRASR